MISWRIGLVLVAWSILGCSSRRKSEERGPVGASVGAANPSPAVASAPTTTTPARTTVLYGWGGIPPEIAAQKSVPSALSAAVLRGLFPKILPGVDRCPEEAGTPEQARAQGWIVPRVSGRSEGAFSRAGAAEQVLGVLVGECGATHAEGWGSRRLVLWADDKVQRDVALPGRLAGAADLDGDGRLELLLERGGTGQGVTTVNLAVARLEPQGLATLAELGVVYEGSCGAQKPEGEEVSLISAVFREGVPLDFELRKERRPCR